MPESVRSQQSRHIDQFRVGAHSPGGKCRYFALAGFPAQDFVGALGISASASRLDGLYCEHAMLQQSAACSPTDFALRERASQINELAGRSPTDFISFDQYWSLIAKLLKGRDVHGTKLLTQIAVGDSHATDGG